MGWGPGNGAAGLPSSVWIQGRCVQYQPDDASDAEKDSCEERPNEGWGAHVAFGSPCVEVLLLVVISKVFTALGHCQAAGLECPAVSVLIMPSVVS